MEAEGEYQPKLNPSQNTASFAITQTLFYNRPLRATQRFPHAENLHLAKSRDGGLQRAGPTAKPLALKVPMLTLLCARHRADPPAPGGAGTCTCVVQRGSLES